MGGNQTAIGIIGVGSIGKPVAHRLQGGAIDGAFLDCAVDVAPAGLDGVDDVELSEAIDRCDILVECSGPSVVAEHAENILSGGADMLVCSVGALADEELAGRLAHVTGGRLFFTTGAIGGLDMLISAARVGPLSHVAVTSTKKPEPLVQPWMSDGESARIRSLSEPAEIFSGTAREAVRLFPKSLNVAASVSLAVGDWDVVRVHLYADPAASFTTHRIEAIGPAGTYRFDSCNKPSPQNPRTSGVVPFAVLESLDNIIGKRGGVIL